MPPQADSGDIAELPSFLRRADVILPVGIVAILAMIIIPVPTFLMNLLIIVNLAAGIVIVLTVIYMEDAINFSVFPSLLLAYTLFGLALNVTTTRNILLGGRQAVQGVITTFGDFVMGGSVIVGVIVFTIIIIIEYLVIVKGTNRVSEVAARFTLDAMPGKQMAIDADLNAGIIDQREALERRRELREEADFYGAMDGASKFVQGYVIAGIVILVVNSLGGWAIGVFMHDMAVLESLTTYLQLTAGDGLAAQIPALMVATASGLVVTQASASGDLGTNLAEQLTAFPKSLYITGGFILVFGLITPFPVISMSLIGIGFIALGYSIQTMRTRALEEAEEAEAEEEATAEEVEEGPEDVSNVLGVDPMELETGYAVIPLVDPDQGGDLLDRITVIRRRMALDMGLIVPPIRIRDNMQLEPNEYVIKIRNAEVARGEVYPDQYMAMNPGEVEEEIEGDETVEPAYGLPAKWINEDQRERAEQAGYTVVDPSSVVATHLTEVIRGNASEILGRDQVRTMVERLEENYPALVDDVYPEPISPGLLQKVLERLLEEEVSVRNLVTIVETMSDRIDEGVTDPNMLAEYCRIGLVREISQQHSDDDGTIYAISLDPQLEQELQQSIDERTEGLNLGPEQAQQLSNTIEQQHEELQQQGIQSVLLVAVALRRPLAEFLSRQIPDLSVLSYQEISDDVELEAVASIQI